MANEAAKDGRRRNDGQTDGRTDGWIALARLRPSFLRSFLPAAAAALVLNRCQRLSPSVSSASDHDDREWIAVAPIHHCS